MFKKKHNVFPFSFLFIKSFIFTFYESMQHYLQIIYQSTLFANQCNTLYKINSLINILCEINSSIKNMYKSFINQHYLQINATLYTKSNQFINQHYLQIIYQSTLFTTSKLFTKLIQIIDLSMSFTVKCY